MHCHYDELVPASDLRLYPGNYRKHPAKQLDLMHTVIAGSASQPGNGWRRSAVVSTLSGCVTKGNGMVQMAQRHGLHIPVEYQTYATRREEIRDLVADNRLADLAQDDETALRKLIGELDPGEIALTAISPQEFDALLTSLGEADPSKLVPVEVIPPPETAWFLIGIPVARFKEISAPLEIIAAVEGIEYHSGTSTKPVTNHDDSLEKNRQP